MLVAACDVPEGSGATDHFASRDSSALNTAPARPRLVILGDSLTAGLGVAPEAAYPALLQKRLDAAGYELEVVNVGESGATTAGGLRRLEWALQENVVALVIALGGNDGLRGLPIEQMRENLAAMITHARERGIAVILAGMEAPPNFGREYTDAFRGVFHELADENDTYFVPFLLDGVAQVPELNQADGIHPNAAGAARVADLVWPAVEAVARRVASGAGGER